MAWYYILFFSVFAFFIIKAILSWMLGDVDVDFDADGDIDFDISSMISFKGVLHFLLGFSTYLAATARFDLTYDALGTYQFTAWHFVIASIIGVVFMVLLWYMYNLMMKLNHSTQENPDFLGCDCSVLTNLGNGRYVVLIKTPLGTFKKTLCHMINKSDVQVGANLRVAKDTVNNVYVIA